MPTKKEGSPARFSHVERERRAGFAKNIAEGLMGHGKPLLRSDIGDIYRAVGLNYASPDSVSYRLKRDLSPERKKYKDHFIYFDEDNPPSDSSFTAIQTRVDKVMMDGRKKGVDTMHLSQVKRIIDGKEVYFTQADISMLNLIRDGDTSSADIFNKTGLKEGTIKNERNSVFKKLGLGDGQEAKSAKALAKAIEIGLIEPPQPARKIKIEDTPFYKIGQKNPKFRKRD